MDITSQILRTDVGKLSREAVKIEYTGDALVEKQREYITISGEVADLEDEKSELVKSFNERLKELKATQKTLLDITRVGYEIVNQDVKCIANDDNGTIEFYDVNTGSYLGNRRQYPNERPSIFNQ